MESKIPKHPSETIQAMNKSNRILKNPYDYTGYRSAEEMTDDILSGVSEVVLSLEQYSALTDETEMKLLQADKVAKASEVRYTAQEVFARAGKQIHK